MTNEYDTLTRLTHRNYTLAGSGTLRTSYDYLDWTTDANRTTGTVDGICYTYSPGGLTLPANCQNRNREQVVLTCSLFSYM